MSSIKTNCAYIHWYILVQQGTRPPYNNVIIPQLVQPMTYHHQSQMTMAKGKGMQGLKKCTTRNIPQVPSWK